MLNIIWGIFIIVAISYGFFSGNIEYVNNSLFKLNYFILFRSFFTLFHFILFFVISAISGF